jgi:hypothetical protein
MVDLLSTDQLRALLGWHDIVFYVDCTSFLSIKQTLRYYSAQDNMLPLPVIASDGSAHTESLYLYPDQIHIQGSLAASFAHNISNQEAIPRTHVTWVDGSARPSSDDSCAGAISFLHPQDDQRTEMVAITHRYPAEDAELVLIRVAFCRASTMSQRFDRVLVFSNTNS